MTNFTTFNEGDRVTLAHNHGPERTGTVTHIVARGFNNSHDTVMVHWDQLGYEHAERSTDLRRAAVTVDVSEWTRLREVEAMAHYHGWTVQEAILSLANVGLSHETTDWADRAARLSYDRLQATHG